MVIKAKKQLFLVVLTLIFIMTGCSTPEVTSNESSQEVNSSFEQQIIIKGLGEEEMILTVEGIKEIQSVSREVTGISSTGEENTSQVTGALLDDVLKQHGFDQKDLMGVRFVAGD